MINRKFGVIDLAGSGARAMLLMSLTTFWDMELEPLYKKKDTEYSIYEYLVDEQHLEEDSGDNQAKIFNILRDPRSIISDPNNGVTFEDWINNFYRCEDLSKKFDIITIRWEQMYDTPGVIQDAIGNWLGYTSFYQYYFTNAHKYYEDVLLNRRSQAVLLADKLIKTINKYDFAQLDEKGNNQWKINRSHKEYLKEQIKLYPKLSETLIKFGYEKDDHWKKNLFK